MNFLTNRNILLLLCLHYPFFSHCTIILTFSVLIHCSKVLYFLFIFKLYTTVCTHLLADVFVYYTLFDVVFVIRTYLY